jgi:hypothetical protein
MFAALLGLLTTFIVSAVIAQLDRQWRHDIAMSLSRDAADGYAFTTGYMVWDTGAIELSYAVGVGSLPFNAYVAWDEFAAAMPFWLRRSRLKDEALSKGPLRSWELAGYGWPFIAFYAVTEQTILSSNWINPPEEIRGAIELPLRNGRTIRIPLLPTWHGAALNSVVYTLAWAGLFAAIDGARERRRDRRGLCIVCGYDVRGDSARPCPECGAASRR